MHLWDKGQIQAYDDLVMLPNARDHERRVTAPGPGVRVLAEPAGQQLHYLGPAPSVKINKTLHTPSKLCSSLRPKFFSGKTAKASDFICELTNFSLWWAKDGVLNFRK